MDKDNMKERASQGRTTRPEMPGWPGCPSLTQSQRQLCPMILPRTSSELFNPAQETMGNNGHEEARPARQAAGDGLGIWVPWVHVVGPGQLFQFGPSLAAQGILE